MWGLYAQINELVRENKELKDRLKHALEVNEKRLDEIADLKEKFMWLRSPYAG